VYFDDFGEVLFFGSSEFQWTDWPECSLRSALPLVRTGRLTVQRRHPPNN
jgi:hypothetical protein